MLVTGLAVASAGPAAAAVPDVTSTEIVVPLTSDWGSAISLTVGVSDDTTPATLPTGTVQFSSDGLPIGDPVTLVGGEATTSYVGLEFGTHAITAAYTPIGNFAASSTTLASTVDVVLTGPTVLRAATLSGTAAVDSTLTCNTGSFSGATSYTYEFLRNGVSLGAASATFTRVLTVSDFGANISCKVTGTNPIGFVASVSASVKIAAGPAAVATVKPRIVGTVKLGKTVTTTLGTWSPTASYKYTYTWKRGAAVVARTYAYKVSRYDIGRSLTVTVTAARTGYLTGTATSAAVIGS
jgi:hypothetical protein